ncbi:hypothetical protein HUT18_19040 [Streptomyces sp. NA04227]|uniref:hypothetical protein n=1 Tax=Streptomyces sp. NA04227 TaxID=2742136 RepID=UPI0015929536|nr:hypothetical protein [Streptomyces sp. NA04227]QKW08160.1 hypothetical protein HUT18_19040 [Streptomyces sp. NA04227]
MTPTDTGTAVLTPPPPKKDGPMSGKGDRALSASRLRGPYWAVARLHRTAMWTLIAAVGAAVVAVVGVRWWVAATEDQSCDRGFGACEGLFGYWNAFEWMEVPIEHGGPFLLCWPAIVAAYVAGPLIGREQEAGLHRVAWSQSVSPVRWLGAKLALTAAVAVPAGLVLAALFQLSRSAITDGGWLDWSERGVFESYGPPLVAYTLLGIGLGALLGLVLRHALAAFVVAGGLVVALTQAASELRWRLWPVSTSTWRTSGEAGGDILGPPRLPSDSLLMEWGQTTSTGRRLPLDYCYQAGHNGKCPSRVEITGGWAEYHPKSHFWYLQLTESVLVLAVAALVVLVTLRVVRSRVG